MFSSQCHHKLVVSQPHQRWWFLMTLLNHQCWRSMYQCEAHTFCGKIGKPFCRWAMGVDKCAWSFEIIGCRPLYGPRQLYQRPRAPDHWVAMLRFHMVCFLNKRNLVDPLHSMASQPTPIYKTGGPYSKATWCNYLCLPTFCSCQWKGSTIL